MNNSRCIHTWRSTMSERREGQTLWWWKENEGERKGKGHGGRKGGLGDRSSDKTGFGDKLFPSDHPNNPTPRLNEKEFRLLPVSCWDAISSISFPCE